MSEPARAPTGYHHGALPETLQQVVLEIIGEAGVGAVTMNEAARRAGVSSGAPYRHFASLDDLLTATAVRTYERFRGRQLAVEAAHVARGAGPKEQLWAAIDDYFAFARDEPAAFALIFDSHIGQRSRDMDPLALADYEHAAGLLAALTGATGHALRTLTLTVSAVVLGHIKLHLDRFSPVSELDEVPRLIRAGVELLLQGFKASNPDDDGPAAGVTPPPRPAAGSRRAQLLEIAREVVAEHGFERATLRDVAQRAGVTAPALYTHFGSREDLLEQVLEVTADEIVADIAATDDPEAGVAERLRTRFERWATVERTRLRVLNQAVAAIDDSPRIATAVEHAQAGWTRFLRDVLEHGLSTGEVRADLDVDDAIELITACFLGVQVAVTGGLATRDLGVLLDDLLELLLARMLSSRR